MDNAVKIFSVLAPKWFRENPMYKEFYINDGSAQYEFSARKKVADALGDFIQKDFSDLGFDKKWVSVKEGHDNHKDAQAFFAVFALPVEVDQADHYDQLGAGWQTTIQDQFHEVKEHIDQCTKITAMDLKPIFLDKYGINHVDRDNVIVFDNDEVMNACLEIFKAGASQKIPLALELVIDSDKRVEIIVPVIDELGVLEEPVPEIHIGKVNMVKSNSNITELIVDGNSIHVDVQKKSLLKKLLKAQAKGKKFEFELLAKPPRLKKSSKPTHILLSVKPHKKDPKGETIHPDLFIRERTSDVLQDEVCTTVPGP